LGIFCQINVLIDVATQSEHEILIKCRDLSRDLGRAKRRKIQRVFLEARLFKLRHVL
jgi:hypothetical protein